MFRFRAGRAWVWGAVLLLLGWAGSAWAQEVTAQLVIDGRPVETDVPPLLVRGRVLVPLRVAATHLGYQVAYQERTRTVVLEKGGLRLYLTVGMSRVRVVRDGKESTVALDVPAVIRQGRTLVPVRFIAQALGAQVEWIGDKRQVVIVTAAAGAAQPGTAPPSAPPAGTPSPVEVTVAAGEFRFAPAQIRLLRGRPVRLTFRNEGRAFHTFTVDGIPVTVDGQARTGLELRAAGGSSARITFTPTSAGTYTLLLRRARPPGLRYGGAGGGGGARCRQRWGHRRQPARLGRERARVRLPLLRAVAGLDLPAP